MSFPPWFFPAGRCPFPSGIRGSEGRAGTYLSFPGVIQRFLMFAKPFKCGSLVALHLEAPPMV